MNILLSLPLPDRSRVGGSAIPSPKDAICGVRNDSWMRPPKITLGIESCWFLATAIPEPQVRPGPQKWADRSPWLRPGGDSSLGEARKRYLLDGMEDSRCLVHPTIGSADRCRATCGIERSCCQTMGRGHP